MFIKIYKILKIKLKQAENKFSLFKWLTKKYVNKINYEEYLNPPFGRSNERPVEYRFVFEQISNYYPKKILDVGTGVTALPHLMANCGLKVTAIDNIKDYWKEGMFNRHYHVINDDIVNSKLKEKFDMITCISVLEHIENADEAVKSMFKLLNPDGYLILTFPYNDKKGVDNTYTLPNSEVKNLPKYKTRAYCRDDLDRWQKENPSLIIKQEYWQFFTGDYWTVGEQIKVPKQVDQSDKHQISCLILKKN